MLIATGILVLGFGTSFLIPPVQKKFSNVANATVSEGRPSQWLLRLVFVARGVGLTSGLLANSGAFLLAPSHARFLRLPIKKSSACFLDVSAALAVPETIVHAYLGHVSWSVAGFVAIGSLSSSFFGAKLAIHSSSGSLERWYGVALTALGLFFLFHV